MSDLQLILSYCSSQNHLVIILADSYLSINLHNSSNNHSQHPQLSTTEGADIEWLITVPF